MPRGTPVDDKTVAKTKKLREVGLTRTVIAERLGLSRTAAKRLVGRK